ncbi:MAG: deoxyribodipyrimidine photo-lyase [Alphaproteobacteria bacterium]|nr:deoxyribodipyrimidine photo-lyase [Alphaproteobacteria bacterium]
MATADASSTSLVWFKRDLRLSDNPALTAALKSGRPLILIYIRDEEERYGLTTGAAADWWLHHSLRDLSDHLRALDSQLVLRSGDPKALIPEICQRFQVEEVFWNQSEIPWIDDRDRELAHALIAADVKPRVFRSSLLTDLNSVLTKSKTPFKVFSAFWRTASKALSVSHPLPAPSVLPTVQGLTSEDLDDWQLCPANPNWAEEFSEHWRVGEHAAQTRLNSFIGNALQDYSEHRDRPDIDGTSRLSPHLAFGEISPRQVWTALETALMNGLPAPQVEKYRAELGWREFAYYLFRHFGDLRQSNFNPVFNAFPWRDNDSALLRWQEGQTGVPMVDAGMRQLWRSGWMHNRVRMIVASYLVKHLGIDWRAGMAWFEDTLVDADPVVNAASWQWVAGSGADAAPYFRIFNPVSQGEKFDPDGRYVGQWVKEIAGLPKRFAHKPWESPPLTLIEAGVRFGDTYPEPIIDLKAGRENALASYAVAKSTSFDNDT